MKNVAVTFPCDSCRNIICADCSQLSASELKCITLQKRILKFHCTKCRNNEFNESLQYIIKDKEEIINNKNDIIKMMQEKLDKFESEYTCRIPSYADMLKQSSSKIIEAAPQNVPDIIITPKSPQNIQITKTEILNNINPSNLNVGIRSLKLTRTGDVIIKCRNKEEFEVLENEAKNKLETNYKIEKTTLKKPRFKILNYQQELTPEEIETAIRSQNKAIEEIKVTFIKKGKNGPSTVFGECSPSTFRQLMDQKKVFIGWERYPVLEDLTVPRCYQCQEFFHKKQNCTNTPICPLCGDEHEKKDCTNKKKVCANCLKSNDKFNKNYSVDHHATDFNCPTMQFHINLAKRKINYNG